MASDDSSKPSFSRRRKWGLMFNVIVRTAVVLVVVVMLNYLGARYFERFYLSSQTRVELSPRTVNILHNLTNSVKVTLYYDKEETLYPTISSLLEEYRAINSRISIVTVDYTRDAAEAQRVKAAYHLGTSASGVEKDLVIFDCDGRSKIVPGRALADYTLEEVPNPNEREFRARPVAFKGERMFTSMLLALTRPEPLKACYLEGHGEHDIKDAQEPMGYGKFASVLHENYIRVTGLSLLGTNTVPSDCNLLIIAGPTSPLPDVELERIEQYLDQGGRLFLMFNYFSRNQPTGLEKIMARWGVVVDGSFVRDMDNTITGGSDVIVSAFARHPVVNSLMGSRIQLVLPRSIRAQNPTNAPPDAPKVVELAFAGPRAVLAEDPTQEQRAWPLAVAVEKGAVRGVITERGATRMVVVGDSVFLGNRQIESGVNRDFESYAANWLLERTTLLEGLGPRPMTEFRIEMTRAQLKTMEWIFLAALPGAVLIFGGLVWLGRRK